MGSHPGWTLVGNYGSGKTHLATAAVWERRRKFNSRGNIWTSIELLKTLNEGFKNDTYHERLAMFSNFEVLGIDDLGAEKVTEFAIQELTQIINARHRDGLPTVYHDEPRPSADGPTLWKGQRRGEDCQKDLWLIPGQEVRRLDRRQ